MTRNFLLKSCRSHNRHVRAPETHLRRDTTSNETGKFRSPCPTLRNFPFFGPTNKQAAAEEKTRLSSQFEALRGVVRTKMPASKQMTSLITHGAKRKKNYTTLLLLHEWNGATALYRLRRSPKHCVISQKCECIKRWARSSSTIWEYWRKSGLILKSEGKNVPSVHMGPSYSLERAVYTRVNHSSKSTSFVDRGKT